MKTRVLQEEFARGGTFRRLLMRYTQASMTQMSLTAVCNRLHTVEQQLCRRLLLSRDRLDTDELVMTRELIANMLGVRRENVAVAAQRLQENGLTSYMRLASVCSTGEVWKRRPASVIRWSKTNTCACSAK